MKLKGKTAIVTGASSGIGKATAIRLAQEGAIVCIIDLNGPGAEKTAEEIKQKKGTAIAMQADVRDCLRIKQIVDDLIDCYEKVDILVNNAGGPASWYEYDGLENKLFIDSKESTWDLVIGVNLLGLMIVTHSVLRNMIEMRKGKIINLGSVAGINGLAGLVDYSAAKGGVIAMTRALAKEVGEYNININCVSPGSIDTNRGGPPTYLRRLGQPDDVANLILFLASEESNFITGQNYIIDGGRAISTKCY